MFNTIAQAVSVTQTLDFETLMPAILIVLVASVVMMVFQLWLFYRLFEKAGQAGWKALIPIYNMVIFVRLGGFSGWWVALNLLPIAGQLVFGVISILAAYNITLNFNKPAWYLLVYLFFQVVWLALLVFDKNAVWSPYDEGKIASSTIEFPVQTPIPQQTPDVGLDTDGQIQPNQPQTPPPAVTPSPIQDIVPPSRPEDK